MIIKGFIGKVGQTRNWTNKDGEGRQSVNLTLSVPYVTKSGEERQDELMCEMNLPSAEFLESLKNTCDSHEKCEFQVGFHISIWEGRQIQNIRVYSVTKLL